MLDYLDNSPKAKAILQKVAEQLSEHKKLEFTGANKVASLPDLDFADSITRKFPLHTKGDVVLSNAFFSEVVGMPEYSSVSLDKKIKMAENILQAATLHGITPTKQIEFLTAKNAENVYYLADFPMHIDRAAFRHFLLAKSAQAGIPILTPVQRDAIMNKAAIYMGIKRKDAEVSVAKESVQSAIARDPMHWKSLSIAQKVKIAEQAHMPARIDRITIDGIKHRIAIARELKAAEMVTALAALHDELTSGDIPTRDVPPDIVRDAIATISSMDRDIHANTLYHALTDPAELFYHDYVAEQRPKPIIDKISALLPELQAALSGVLPDRALAKLVSDPAEFLEKAGPTTLTVIMRITKATPEDFVEPNDEF